MKRFHVSLLALAATAVASPAGGQAVPEVLLRLDDIGMNHSVNLAIEDFARTGVPFSTSVMFATPWYQEAVEILKKYPHASVGVHLALNSEWKGYRWGPVLGRAGVPSLVDSVGYFHPSSRAFLESEYSLEEVERELEAQLDRALRSGLRIDYVDHHMGTAAATPELRAVVERLAAKHGLAISTYFGEAYHSPFATPVEEKQAEFLAMLDSVQPGPPHLVVIHVGRSTPEMDVLVDQNNAAQNTEAGEPMMSRHRAAELEMLLSPELARRVREGRVRFVTYADLVARHGLGAMRPPR